MLYWIYLAVTVLLTGVWGWWTYRVAITPKTVLPPRWVWGAICSMAWAFLFPIWWYLLAGTWPLAAFLGATDILMATFFFVFSSLVDTEQKKDGIKIGWIVGPRDGDYVYHNAPLGKYSNPLYLLFGLRYFVSGFRIQTVQVSNNEGDVLEIQYVVRATPNTPCSSWDSACIMVKVAITQHLTARPLDFQSKEAVNARLRECRSVLPKSVEVELQQWTVKPAVRKGSLSTSVKPNA